MDRLLPLLIAPFVGSFLGVLIRRLPHGQPVLWDRSRCESCGAALGIPDLAPLASYAALRGRCRSCGGAIDPAHWHVEALALLVAGSAVLADPAGPLLWVDCALGWTLLTLAWIDAEHMLLPDVLTLPLLVAGLGATLWLEPEAAWEHAAAATLGFTGLWAVGALYRAARGRDGVGGGDPKLLAALGAWVGTRWPAAGPARRRSCRVGVGCRDGAAGQAGRPLHPDPVRHLPRACGLGGAAAELRRHADPACPARAAAARVGGGRASPRPRLLPRRGAGAAHRESEAGRPALRDRGGWDQRGPRRHARPCALRRPRASHRVRRAALRRRADRRAQRGPVPRSNCARTGFSSACGDYRPPNNAVADCSTLDWYARFSACVCE